MGNSVGTVKIPIVSTFDASGVQAAKQGLKDLQGAQPGGGGGGSGGGGKASSAGRSSQASYADEADQIFEKTRTANEKYSYQIAKLDDLHKRGKISTDTYTRAQKQAADSLPKSAGMMQRLGVGQAGQAVADQMGFGGITSAMGTVGAVAGVAAVGVAIYGLTQRAAEQSIALRSNAKQLGVSVEYYGKLEKAARSAGLSASEVAGALGQAQSKAAAAATGDIGQSIYLSSLGLSQAEIQEGMADPEKLAQRLRRRNLTNGQKAAVFGGVESADAVMGAGDKQGGLFDANAGTSLQASKMGMGLWNFGVNMVGAWGGILSGKSRQDLEDEAAVKDKAEKEGKLHQYMVAAGTAQSQSLLSAREIEKNTNATHKDFVYAETTPDANGHYNRANIEMQNRLHNLASVQAREQRYAAEAPFIASPREQAERDRDIVAGKTAGHYYGDDRQARQARINVDTNEAGALSGVRSNRENFVATGQLGVANWQNARGEGRSIDEQMAGVGEGQGIRTQGFSQEHVDVARKFGDQMTDIADSITRSGPLAAGADVNSMAGAQQMVQAEYGMSQSKDALNLIAQLLDQMVKNTDPKNQAAARNLADTAQQQLGFRNADPIMGQ